MPRRGRPARRSAKARAPVRGKPLEVVRAPAVREGMVQLGILETALVRRRREGEKGLLPSGELVDGWSRHDGMLPVTFPRRDSSLPVRDTNGRREKETRIEP